VLSTNNHDHGPRILGFWVRSHALRYDSVKQHGSADMRATPRQQVAACRQAPLVSAPFVSRCASTEGKSDNKNHWNGSSCLCFLTCSAVQGAGGSNGPHVMQLPENSALQKETSPPVNFALLKEISPPTNFAPVK
jgi:hypothetical protein